MNGWSARTRSWGLRPMIALVCMLLVLPLASASLAADAAVDWQAAISGEFRPNQGISVATNAFVPISQSDLIMADQMLVGRNGTKIQKVSQTFGGLLDAPSEGYEVEAKIVMDGVYIARTAGGAYVKLCMCGTYQMGMGGDAYYTSYRATVATGVAGGSTPTPPTPPEPTPPTPTPPTPPDPTPVPAPSDPGSLTAQVVGGKVVLTWAGFATPNEGYYVFKKSGSSGYGLPLTDFPSSALTYTDDAVRVGSTYTYVVKAYKEGKYTDATSEATITVTAEPPKPAQGVLKGASANGKVELSWDAFAMPNDGYYVYKRTTSSYGPPATDFPTLVRSFTDTAVEAGKTYTYVVKAYVDGEVSTQTNEVTVTVAAPQVIRRVIRLQVENPSAEVNGKQVTLDVAPQILQNRTLVPLRFVAEALGADLKWDGVERKITLTGSTGTVILWVDRPDALVNGTETPLDVPPTIIRERTLVPLRFVSENLGAKLKWNATDRSIELTSEVAAAQVEPTEQEPAEPEPAKPVLPEPTTYTSADWVGKWRCMSFAGNFCPVGWNMELRADGTYSWGAGADGAYRATGNKASFEGSAAFLGPAEMFDGGRFTFYYTRDGFQMYVAYSKE